MNWTCLGKDNLNVPRNHQRKRKLLYVDGYLLSVPEAFDVASAHEEYSKILDPGPNPYVYDTPEQNAWLDKIKLRENFLVSKYGGDEGGPWHGKIPTTYYGVLTFIHFLIREKEAKVEPYDSFHLEELD